MGGAFLSLKWRRWCTRRETRRGGSWNRCALLCSPPASGSITSARRSVYSNRCVSVCLHLPVVALPCAFILESLRSTVLTAREWLHHVRDEVSLFESLRSCVLTSVNRRLPVCMHSRIVAFYCAHCPRVAPSRPRRGPSTRIVAFSCHHICQSSRSHVLLSSIRCVLLCSPPASDSITSVKRSGFSSSSSSLLSRGPFF